MGKNTKGRLMNSVTLISEDKIPNAPPDNAPVYCDSCGWKGILSDCEVSTDSEGWEYPEYQVLVCPKCNEFSVNL